MYAFPLISISAFILHIEGVENGAKRMERVGAEVYRGQYVCDKEERAPDHPLACTHIRFSATSHYLKDNYFSP